MNKTLSKEFMKGSNLKNKYLKSRSEEDRRSIKLRKTKKFIRISIKKDKKELLFDLKQKNVLTIESSAKPLNQSLLSNKLVNSEKITFAENEKILLLLTRRYQKFEMVFFKHVFKGYRKATPGCNGLTCLLI